MKKSKILMPILASAGTVAAIAPMVCLTSCGKNLSLLQESKGKFKLNATNVTLEKGKTIKFTAKLLEGFTIVNPSYVTFKFEQNGAPIKVADGNDVWLKHGKSKEQLQWDDGTKGLNCYFVEVTELVAFGINTTLTVEFTTESKIEGDWSVALEFQTA